MSKFINKYSKKLVKTLPKYIIERFKKKPLSMNIIFEGGSFNGSYLLGACYYLKLMEEKKYIQVNKISGTSIGAIIGILYLIDKLDLFSEYYKVIAENYNTNFDYLSVVNIFKLHITNDILINVLNNKLYISYFNLQENRQVIKSTYNSVEDLCETVKRSSYVPLIMKNNFLYKKKYVDGLFPHIFKQKKGIKNLYLNIKSYDKISHIFNIKNEKSNDNRVLYGLIEMNSFFIKENKTIMCSFVEDWNVIDYFYYVIFKIIVYILLFNIKVIFLYYLLIKKMDMNYLNIFLFKLSKLFIQNIIASL
jgi:hypothetical protein